MERALPQRQIFIISAVFEALSGGDLKSIRKVVQQLEKLRIIIFSIELMWGTTATIICEILKSTDI